jgi:translation elongation factor EF-G
MTRGYATFTHRFRGYEEVPPDAAQRIAAENREEVMAEA